MKKSECTPEQWAEQLAKWREWHQKNDAPKDAARKAEWLRNDRAANPEKYRARNREYYAKNKDKMREYFRKKTREWHDANPERHQELQREWRVRNAERIRTKTRVKTLAKYGLTPEAFAELKARQNNLCALCHGEFPSHSRGTHVDHCHKTGAVRGILCNGCNRGLGHFEDSPEMLRRAAEYLERAR